MGGPVGRYRGVAPRSKTSMMIMRPPQHGHFGLPASTSAAVGVFMLSLRRQFADRHVFDHALSQRAYGLIGHEGCSCLGEGCEPLISRQDAPSRYPLGCVASRSALPRERFSPLAHRDYWLHRKIRSRSGHSGNGFISRGPAPVANDPISDMGAASSELAAE